MYMEMHHVKAIAVWPLPASDFLHLSEGDVISSKNPKGTFIYNTTNQFDRIGSVLPIARPDTKTDIQTEQINSKESAISSKATSTSSLVKTLLISFADSFFNFPSTLPVCHWAKLEFN